MSFKLLKEIEYFGNIVPVGTIGTIGKRPLYSRDFLFQNGETVFKFSSEYILTHPEYFEATESPKWTDSDMLDFANSCMMAEPLNPDEVKKHFNEFLKTHIV